MSTFGKVLTLVVGYFLIVGLAVNSADRSRPPTEPSALAHEGLLSYRSHGCVSCHAVYGLGGHLGPDLTNVIGRGGQELVRLRLRYGTRRMPSFDLPDSELDALVAWLRHVDQTGQFPLEDAMGHLYGRTP